MLHPFNTRTLHAPEERLAVAAVAASHRLPTVTSPSHDPQLCQLAALDISIPANDQFCVRAGWEYKVALAARLRSLPSSPSLAPSDTPGTATSVIGVLSLTPARRLLHHTKEPSFAAHKTVYCSPGWNEAGFYMHARDGATLSGAANESPPQPRPVRSHKYGQMNIVPLFVILANLPA